MVHDSKTLRLFVAMPGTTMGETARWNAIPEIKRRLLQPVADRLADKLQISVELVIEKDKSSSGRIHPSMFAEAVDADVYIADLTGANANVYLELGVRWALKDGVTIPICQQVGDVKFNATGVRVISYGPMPDELEAAVDQIVQASVEGLQTAGRVDSPVRDSLTLVPVPRAEWDRLHEEITRLTEQQAEELIAAARTSHHPDQALDLLRRAVARNPVSVAAHYELGLVLRREAQYNEAVQELRRAVELKDDLAAGWRELGVTYSKSKLLSEAAEAFQRAVELDDSDAETWATLGGLRRRIARNAATRPFDWAMLAEARNAYRRAAQLSGNDTYAVVNEARLDLLLSAIQPQIRPDVIAQLYRLEHLARYAAEKAEAEGCPDPWKRFDLADTLLLTGRAEEGLAEVRSAIELIDQSSRESYLSSVVEPWMDFLSVDVLDELTASGLHEAVSICEQAMKASKR